MKTYSVGYDLRKPGRDYTALFNAIKSYPNWAHVLKSQWLIRSDKTAVAIRDHLARYMDENDGLLINEFGAAAWQGLTGELSEWIRKAA